MKTNKTYNIVLYNHIYEMNNKPLDINITFKLIRTITRSLKILST